MKQRLLLTIKVWKGGKHFIAYNPELDVASQGPTPSRAQENLREAIALLIETTKRRGTFKQMLEDAGLAVRKTEYGLPQISFSALEVTV